MFEASDRPTYVYKLTNKINGKVYVGITVNLKERLKGHRHADTPIGRALRKYGVQAFDYEVLTQGSRDYASLKEIEFISVYRSDDRELGYNLTAGGENPPHYQGSAHPNFGKPRAPETIAKIKAKRALQVTSAATKAKMSVSRSGERNPNGKFTTETIKQVKAAQGTTSAKALAAEIGVGISTIYDVWAGRTWRHV